MNRAVSIIGFGDIHMSLHNLERLAPVLAAAEVVLLAGDLTSFGGPEEAAHVLAATHRHARYLLAVSGNLDRREVIDFLREQGVSLHGESRRLGDIGIFGCGGSNLTPLHTPTELSDEDIRAILERGHAGVARAPLRLMVCHTPPVHTATDRIAGGLHVGSPAVRHFIERHQPHLCLTGHIHEAAAVDRIGRTTVVNPGAFRDGGYAVITRGPSGLTAELAQL